MSIQDNLATLSDNVQALNNSVTALTAAAGVKIDSFDEKIEQVDSLATNTVQAAIVGSTNQLAPTRYRHIRGIIDAYSPVSLLSENCFLKKLRSDYTEFAFYYPIHRNGMDWARMLFTHRLNTGLQGCVRHCYSTLAKLYASTSLAPLDKNTLTNTEAQPASSAQATTVSTSRTGTWAASATVGGVTDIRYSVTVGDKVSYTVTGASRISLRTYANTSNGGIANVTVKESGVQISASNYLVPDAGSGARLIDLRLNSSSELIGLAQLLDPSKTYVVEIIVDASNPAAGRVYEGGLLIYATPLSNTAVGRQGSFDNVTVTSVTTAIAHYAGARVVQAFSGTRVVWQYALSVNSGKADIRVYTAAGVEIPSGNYRLTANEVDLYTPNSPYVAQVVVAEGLPNGNYLLVATTKTTRNAASTGYRMYDAGLIAYNEAVPGVVGVDAFDDLGMPSNLQNANQVPPGIVLMGTGNLEQAIYVRRPEDAHGSQNLAGGVHGFESAMANLVFEKDGVVLDYAGAAVNASWTLKDLKVSFTTNLMFPQAPTAPFALSSFVLNMGSPGYTATVTRTTVAACVIYQDYSFMLNVPSKQTGALFSQGVEGGYGNWALDGGNNYSFSNYNDSQIAVPEPCKGAAVWTTSYATYGQQLDLRMSRAPYENTDNFAGTLTILQDRSDGIAKYYNKAFLIPTTGRILPIGDSYKHVNHYRSIKGSGFAQLFAGH